MRERRLLSRLAAHPCIGGAEVFFGGLAGLVGDCRRDVLAAMTDEHLAVAAGYGASDAVFKTSNYKVETTPRKEWLFVYAPEALAEALPAGVSQASGRALGARAKEPWRHFLAHAPALISAKFAAAGHGVAVGAAEFARLEVLREEVRRPPAQLDTRLTAHDALVLGSTPGLCGCLRRCWMR